MLNPFFSSLPLESLAPMLTFLHSKCIEVSRLSKGEEAQCHKEWFSSLSHCWVVYPDGSLSESAVVSAAGVVKQVYTAREVRSLSGGCCLGGHCTNKDAKIYGIQEAVSLLLSVLD